MTRRHVLILLRVGAATLVATAVAVQLNHLNDQGNFRPANFFSFFTIQSNLLAAGVLLYGAARLGLNPDLPRLDALRAAALLYLSLTGIVYGVLLAGYQEELQLTLPWVDTVLHRVLPLVMVADWLIQPPSTRLGWRQARWWLAYPVAFVAYTLIRGPIVDWYPYPFLDPRNDGGYVAVAGYVVAIAVGVLAAVWLLLWTMTRRRPAMP